MNRTMYCLAALTLGVASLASLGCPKKAEKDKGEQASAVRASVRDGVLSAHHDKCVELFVKTSGFGLGRMMVLTHDSPSYPKSLDLPSQEDGVDEAGEPLGVRPVTWVMDKVELVSLLNDKTEGVYSAEGMRKDFLRMKKRDFDSFEASSLPQLRAGEALRVQELPGEVRVLGAIRARADCKTCHAKHEVGSLLGAFTYVYKPAVPTP